MKHFFYTSAAALLLLTSGCNPVNETTAGIGVDGLRVERFASDEVKPLIAEAAASRTTTIFECAIYLKASEEDTDYIFVMNGLYEESDAALMKVNGEWSTFSGIVEPTRFPLPVRDFSDHSETQDLTFGMYIDNAAGTDQDDAIEDRQFAITLSSSRKQERQHKITIKPLVTDTDC